LFSIVAVINLTGGFVDANTKVIGRIGNVSHGDSVLAVMMIRPNVAASPIMINSIPDLASLWIRGERNQSTII